MLDLPRRLLAPLPVLLLLALAGCSSTPCPNPDWCAYFPMELGNRWTYDVYSTGAVDPAGAPLRTEVLEVTASRPGWEESTATFALTEPAVETPPSWTYRARTQGVAIIPARPGPGAPPPRIVLPWPSAPGMQWTWAPDARVAAPGEDDGGGLLPFRSRVESVDDPVSVPAGDYRCIRIRVETDVQPSWTFWYARNVGLVKFQRDPAHAPPPGAPTPDLRVLRSFTRGKP